MRRTNKILRIARNCKSVLPSATRMSGAIRTCTTATPAPSTFRVALDWIPNAVHAGIFVAQQHGFFDKHGVTVEVTSPAFDGYATSPAARLSSGEADLIFCPSETVISLASNPHMNNIVGVASVFDRDTSSIAVLASSEVQESSQLDGKKYASYDARFEDHIVAAMVKAGGGKGDIRCSTPPRLQCFEAVMDGSHDATWIFDWWEGVLALRDGKQLREFRMSDAGIPYGCSPVLAAGAGAFGGKLEPGSKGAGEGCMLALEPSASTGARAPAGIEGGASLALADDDWSRERNEVFRAFMQCIHDGYEAARDDPNTAADAVQHAHLAMQEKVREAAGAAEAGTTDLTPPDKQFFRDAQHEVANVLSAEHAAGRRWGAMEAGRWDAFVRWMSEQERMGEDGRKGGKILAGLDGVSEVDIGPGPWSGEVPRVDPAVLFTNQFLPSP